MKTKNPQKVVDIISGVIFWGGVVAFSYLNGWENILIIPVIFAGFTMSFLNNYL